MTSKRVGRAGLVLLLLILLVAVLAGALAPYDPNALTGSPFERPSPQHLLGTNDIGQDILSELLYGARTSLLVGALSTAVTMVLAVAAGVCCGWMGGWVDRLSMKVTTFFLTIPFLPSVIILSAFTNPGVVSMSLILGVMSWPHVSLVLRSQTLQLKSAPYIQTIRAMGAGNGYIILRHLLRELRPLLLYWTVSRMKTGILMESSLSFLGLGNPVAKSWGSMIYYAEAKNAIITGAWLWWVVPPGLCICLVCLALMMISYGLEETGGERRQSR